MTFPSRKKMKNVLKKLEKTEGTLSPPTNPTPLQKFRFDIQQKFVGYALKNKLSQKELAKRLEIDEAKISKILRNRINEFSTDRLIRLYERINPKVVLKVS